MTKWFEVDDAAFVAGVEGALTQLIADQRARVDRKAEAVAAAAEDACGGTFSVRAKRGRRVQPIGGRYSATVIVERKHQAAHGRFYRDPGPGAAWFYEFGTSRQPPRPFLRPTLARAAAEGL